MKGHRMSAALMGGVILICAILGACKSSKSPEDPGGGTDTLTFSGTVTNGGQPFAGVQVFLSYDASRSTATGADGAFSFSGLLSGTYILTPSKQGYGFSPSNQTVGAQSQTNLTFAAGAPQTGTETGEVAVDFTANDQNGNPVTLSDSHGKVVLIDFTADWCGPCRQKAETAEQFYQAHKNQGFMYILVVIEGDPRAWADTYGLTFPVLDDNSHAIYNLFRKTDIPLPHVLDRNMTIRYKKVGWVKAEVEAEILKYL